MTSERDGAAGWAWGAGVASYVATMEAMVRMLGRVMVVAWLMSALARGVAAQQVTAMQDLDQNRFVGTWVEVARYPYKREKTCVGNTKLLVALGDKANQLQFVNSCDDKKGYQDVRRSTARGPKAKRGRVAATGEFKVAAMFPFSTRIWVLGMAADDSWAVVGSPDHKHLWIFSKAAVMSPGVLAEAEAVASREGYDLGRLTMTPGAK